MNGGMARQTKRQSEARQLVTRPPLTSIPLGQHYHGIPAHHWLAKLPTNNTLGNA